jgi:nondiscriminating aspartyl-tRNA synthetase
MRRSLAQELGAHVGERVRLQGWLHHQRQLAQVGFVLVRDRSGISQVVVVDPNMNGNESLRCRRSP